MSQATKPATEFLIPFDKMHGLGNDFVIVDYRHLPEEHNEEAEKALTKAICDRNYGVGADGLIIIAPVLDSEEAIFSWRYYNSDGSIGEMCGNGIRCAAKYLYERGLSGEDSDFKIETLSGDIGLSMLDDHQVKVNMGPPRDIAENKSLETDKGFKFDYSYVSMGNPHAIAFFDGIDSEELGRLSCNGVDIEVHPDFPNRTNVEFARFARDNYIDLIVWERGCGFTRACGTGACATVVAAVKQGLCKADTDVIVKLPGGELIIRWDSVTDDLFMTGPATLVFSGNYIHEVTR